MLDTFRWRMTAFNAASRHPHIGNWGLRDYGTARWEGGDAACDHIEMACGMSDSNTLGPSGYLPPSNAANVGRARQFKERCGKCGGRRIDSQLGLERTPEEYVANMVEVFREVRRALRADGVCFVNLGDSYASGDRSTYRSGASDNKGQLVQNDMPRPQTPPGLKPKDLVGIPWRIAFALQADGWWLRQDIIWAKPNPMPESVTDRCTKSHEYVFLLTKSARYFYDAEAVKEPSQDVAGIERFKGKAGISADDYEQRKWTDRTDGLARPPMTMRDRAYCESGRNLRSVWHIATQPYKEAHFATFPEKLVEPCILAGTSERGCCEKCGAPWEREIERTPGNGELRCHGTSPGAKHLQGPQSRLNSGSAEQYHENRDKLITLGWKPTCSCGAATKPCVVLDPFCGSGTVGVVCARTGRDFVGLDISEKYLELARARIGEVPFALPFHEVPAVEKAGA